MATSGRVVMAYMLALLTLASTAGLPWPMITIERCCGRPPQHARHVSQVKRFPASSLAGQIISSAAIGWSAVRVLKERQPSRLASAFSDSLCVLAMMYFDQR